jgi:hypothetical protein
MLVLYKRLLVDSHVERSCGGVPLALQQVLLERFSVMTESVYASRGIDDYTRMKKYCDYLDYDSATLFQSKNKGQAGLRNIGNSKF